MDGYLSEKPKNFVDDQENFTGKRDVQHKLKKL
jgi:hypothetical protein